MAAAPVIMMESGAGSLKTLSSVGRRKDTILTDDSGLLLHPIMRLAEINHPQALTRIPGPLSE